MNSLNNSAFDNIRLKKYAATASILVAVILSSIKAIAAFSTCSLSILSSMIDSLADIVSSAISYIAVRFSNKPPNEKHRYGYGKAESISALMQAAFIAGSGGFILYDGISRFINPTDVQQTFFGLLVMGISLFLTIALIIFQKYVINKTRSLAIQADSAHYVVDLLTNIAIILSLIVVEYLHWQWFDVLTAILISGYLIFNAGHIALEALGEITDCEIDDEIKNKIINSINNTPEVKGYHDLRTRISGARIFIELHLELEGNLPLLKAHQISDRVENKIVEILPNAQVIIHQDPYGLHEKRLDHEINGHCNL